MSGSYQTVYSRPYSPPYLFAAIVLLSLVHASFHDGSTFTHSSILTTILRALAGSTIGIVVGVCILATVFDLATTITTTRRIGRNTDSEGNTHGAESGRLRSSGR